jgi:hypothetical protein
VLCDVVVNSGQQNATQVCNLLKQVTSLLPDVGGAVSTAGNAASTPKAPVPGQAPPTKSLLSLLGGAG